MAVSITAVAATAVARAPMSPDDFPRVLRLPALARLLHFSAGITRKKVIEHAPRRLMVRVNALGSGHNQSDLQAIVGASPAGIMLPKVESVEHVREIHERLLGCERHGGLRPGSLGVVALIESWRYRGPAVGWDAVVGHAAAVRRCRPTRARPAWIGFTKSRTRTTRCASANASASLCR